MKNRSALVAGLAMFLSFCILSAAGPLARTYLKSDLAFGAILGEIAAFLIPTLIIRLLSCPDMLIHLRIKVTKDSVKSIGFTVKFAFAVSFLSFLLNFFVYWVTGYYDLSLNGMLPQTGVAASVSLLSFASIVIVPSLLEEIFMRGAVFSAYENVASTAICIVVNGFCFALLHGSPLNFAGPFMAGCAYAYLTFALGSVWPAIIAHFINNMYYLAIGWLVSVYSTFGIWDYFIQINVILFLLTAYLTFRSWEKQITAKRIRTFQHSQYGTAAALLNAWLNPGVLALIFAFFAKTVLHLF